MAILLIDDQLEPLSYHTTALKNAGYDVVPLKCPEAVIEFFEDIPPAGHPEAIILDIFMPIDVTCKNKMIEETNLPANTAAGVLLYEYLQRKGLIVVPVIVLTQSQVPAILNTMRTALGDKNVLDKFNTTPLQLVREIERILAGG